jgi:hypothetical protein
MPLRPAGCQIVWSLGQIGWAVPATLGVGTQPGGRTQAVDGQSVAVGKKVQLEPWHGSGDLPGWKRCSLGALPDWSWL